MFCVNCGNQIEDGSVSCPICGYDLRDVMVFPVQDSGDYVSVEEPIPVVEEFVPVVEESVPFIEESTPAVEESTPTVGVEIPTVEDLISDGAGEIPAVEDLGIVHQPAAEEPPQKRGLRKGAKIAIIVSIIVTVLIVAIIIIAVVTEMEYQREQEEYYRQEEYKQSDEYKLSEAKRLINSGNYSDGVDMLSDVYTSEAECIKDFNYVYERGQYFVETVDSSYKDFSAESAYESFYDAFYDFESSYSYSTAFLPSGFKDLYDRYGAAFEYIDEFIGSSNDDTNKLLKALYDVQSVMLNEVECRESSQYGQTFTINGLQKRVDTSKAALNILDDYDFSAIECDEYDLKPSNSYYSTYKIYTSSFLSSTMSTFINECSSEITTWQSEISKLKQQYSMSDELYYKTSDYSYSSYVGTNLNPIDDDYDIKKNRNLLASTLRVDILYYVVDGTKATHSLSYFS